MAPAELPEQPLPDQAVPVAVEQEELQEEPLTRVAANAAPTEQPVQPETVELPEVPEAAGAVLQDVTGMGATPAAVLRQTVVMELQVQQEQLPEQLPELLPQAPIIMFRTGSPLPEIMVAVAVAVAKVAVALQVLAALVPAAPSGLQEAMVARVAVADWEDMAVGAVGAHSVFMQRVQVQEH